MDRTIKLILAGNSGQFARYLKDRGRNHRDLGTQREYKFISSIEDIDGYKEYDLIKTGTWYNQPAELVKYAESSPHKRSERVE
jgi:hypothetical protein